MIGRFMNFVLLFINRVLGYFRPMHFNKTTKDIALRKRMKSGFVTVLLTLLCLSLFGSDAHAKNPIMAKKSNKITPIKGQAPKQPTINQPLASLQLETLAKQVLLIDYATGVILLEKNADEPMFPSSMTKIMTAYLIFESLKQGQIQMDTAFPVSEKAWRMGGSKMFVPLNAMVRVDDLLKGIIIQSGNDACIVIAEGLGGSEENFAAAMTEKAREMGAHLTTFRNSSGWPDPDHQTTARDLAIISHRLLTDFPEFYSMFGEKEYVFNNIRQWNRNPLLYKNLGCDGIKTGHTDAGGYGIVASVLQGNRRLILVANGMPTEQARSNEVLKLLTWGLQTFDNYTLFRPGDVVDAIPVWLGTENSVEATVSQDVIMTLPRTSRKGLKVDIEYNSPASAPITKGSTLGKVIITLPSQELPIEFPLVAASSIERAGFLKKIKDSFSYLIWGKA
jgi:serine-type D-Ala-D-Ala carboxypeptidase (penicillin-binding protein 5/6)